MRDIMKILQDKDNKKAYALLKDIGAKSTTSEEYYSYFDDFAGLMNAKSSYVRIRGYQGQPRWDESGKLQKKLPSMFALLHDDKPIVVRQCLAALHEVVLYRSELCETIKAELETVNVLNYMDSMSSLIKKDIDELLKMIGE